MKKLLSVIKLTSIAFSIIVALLLSSCSMLPKNNLHGEALLNLPDDQLFETVYSYLIESYADEDIALPQTNPVHRTIYILSIFDMELQNGGLCQFFVNPSRSLAPYVEECLKTVGAEDHCQLFAEFVSNHQIDLYHLDSFKISSIQEYVEQTKRYDFDSFDSSYYKFTALHEYMVAYIKANISEF